MQKSHKRTEDRRSCHNLAFVVALAQLAGDHELYIAGAMAMVNMVTTVKGQAAN